MAQTNVEVKGNELRAARDVLASVDLQGRIVTGDAMFTQHNLWQQLKQAGGA